MDKKKKIKRKKNSWKDWKDKLEYNQFYLIPERGLVFATLGALLLSIMSFVLLWRDKIIWNLITFIMCTGAFVFTLIFTIMELRDDNEDYDDSEEWISNN